jgi:ABC-type Fe3+ transport system permease subunit
MSLTILFILVAFLILLIIIKKNRKVRIKISNKHKNIKFYKSRWWWNIDDEFVKIIGTIVAFTACVAAIIYGIVYILGNPV